MDDDRQVLKYLTEMLQEAGYDTVACERFQDAKALLATSRPDLLLTDVRLGAYNGLQLGIYARDHHPGLPDHRAHRLRGPDAARRSRIARARSSW